MGGTATRSRYGALNPLYGTGFSPGVAGRLIRDNENGAVDSREPLLARCAERRGAAAELSLGRGIYLEGGRDHKVIVTALLVKGDGMAAAKFEALEVSEVDVVRRWRFDELVRAGYDDEDAIELAFHLDVDLHLATDLVRQGCPSSTAIRIAL